MESKAKKPAKADEQPVQRRLRKDARQKAILEEAATLFAASGFDVSTREIASECGITQAALYKHFPSKDAIIQGVFQTAFLDGDKTYFAEYLSASTSYRPINISKAYTEFFERIDSKRQRLFLLAAMHGYELPRTFSAPLDHEILEPVVAQLRAELNLPSLDEEPLCIEERELAMMLHSSVVFLALRLNIYGIERLREDYGWIISQHVRTWFHGAILTMGDIHSD